MFDGDLDSGSSISDSAYTILAISLAFIFGFLVDFMIKAFIDFVIYAMDLIRNAVVNAIGYVPNTPPALPIWTSIAIAIVSASLSTAVLFAMVSHKIDEAERLLTLAFLVIMLVALSIINIAINTML